MRAAQEIADEVLFADAAAVDRADRVPTAHLDLLAAEGFYGLTEPDDLAPAVEAFAGGCLATAFVWLQHHGALRAAAGTAWEQPLAAGALRAGIALAGLRPGPAPLAVRETDGGWVLDGEVPFVTGWDLVDLLLVAARSADDVRFFLLDARPAPTVRAQRLGLVAANASRTVNLSFDGHSLPGDRLLATVPFAQWRSADASGSALNGFLALGVAGRCTRLLGDDGGGLGAELARVRADLREADAAATPAARAAASALAWRAAGALTVRTGSRAVLVGGDAERLAREAALLLAFGNRPAIRDALLARL
jgi:alkylation response protein AidB-like acyl-CoA dehydrogenase